MPPIGHAIMRAGIITAIITGAATTATKAQSKRDKTKTWSMDLSEAKVIMLQA